MNQSKRWNEPTLINGKMFDNQHDSTQLKINLKYLGIELKKVEIVEE